MSKERFEELAYNVGISQSGEYARMKANDYAFLYEYAKEQAERVRELENSLVNIESLWKNSAEATDDRQLAWLMYSEVRRVLGAERDRF